MRTFFILVALTTATLAQSLTELMPWVADRDGVSLGMSVADFRKVNPNAQLAGLSDEEPKIDANFSGGFFEAGLTSPALATTDDTLIYSFIKGKLAAVGWGNKADQSLQLTEAVRNVLVKKHGKPLSGHTAKPQDGSIAKVTVEAFSIKGSDTAKLILSSDATGLNSMAIDFALETRATLADLCFSYEKNAAALKKQGLKDLADPEKTTDLLADLAGEE